MPKNKHPARSVRHQPTEMHLLTGPKMLLKLKNAVLRNEHKNWTGFKNVIVYFLQFSAEKYLQIENTKNWNRSSKSKKRWFAVQIINRWVFPQTKHWKWTDGTTIMNRCIARMLKPSGWINLLPFGEILTPQTAVEAFKERLNNSTLGKCKYR